VIEEQRDAHLREALRHAPDARLQPPPGLSELILKEARAKARDTSTPVGAPRHPLLGIWDWLARPSVATGFAGVMVATLVGLMWWDQPMDEALPRAPVPTAAPAPAPQQAPAATAAPAAPAPAVEAERTPPPATVRRAVEADKADARQRKKEAPPPAAAKPAAPAEQRAAAAPLAREEAAALPPAPAPAAMPPPAPSVVDTDTASASAGAAGPLAKSRPADETQRTRAMAPAAEATSSTSGAPPTLDQLRQSRPEASPTLAQLRTAIAAEPARWSWQRDGSAPKAMNDVVRSWLARLDADAGDRWQPADAGALPPGREIQLLRDGHLQHSFRFTEGGVLWRRPQGGWQRVPMLPTSLSVLETSAP
jgi:hypothetical protein